MSGEMGVMLNDDLFLVNRDDFTRILFAATDMLPSGWMTDWVMVAEWVEMNGRFVGAIDAKTGLV